MYANKENAWKGWTNDRFYGARRIREMGKRFWADKPTRTFIITMFVLITFGGYVLLERQKSERDTSGLVGRKRRQYKSRLTVILDVDETIVSYGDRAYRMRAPVVPRPHLAELLDFLSEIDAEVILWSACSDRYMKQVLQSIDPHGVRVSHYLTRDPLWYSKDHYYEKNVRWLRRPLDDIIMFENRPLSIRNCNKNSVLVDDFIRGEYMDTGMDHPRNDRALRTIKEIVMDLETSGAPVQEYLADKKRRHPDLKEIPCHLGMRQMPDELAVGNFYFIGEKYRSGALE